MKKILLTSAIIGITTLSGCTTIKEIFGNDKTGTHDTHAQVNNRVPVTTLNNVLVDSGKKMTLYTYDKDTTNKSNCNALCLAAWPAFLAPTASQNTSSHYTTIQRDDGRYQWTLDGKPLYFYANDTVTGDKKGDGKMGTWHVIPTRQ